MTDNNKILRDIAGKAPKYNDPRAGGYRLKFFFFDAKKAVDTYNGFKDAVQKHNMPCGKIEHSELPSAKKRTNPNYTAQAGPHWVAVTLKY